jgi:hypothetical protein
MRNGTVKIVRKERHQAIWETEDGVRARRIFLERFVDTHNTPGSLAISHYSDLSNRDTNIVLHNTLNVKRNFTT